MKPSFFFPFLLSAIGLVNPAIAQKNHATLPVTLTDGAKMLDQPAPPFILRDLEGAAVSLSDYKGKVLVLDFWATWCVPCKLSFPGVQLAIQKYKEDPEVKFLFIDINETIDNYADTIRKFLDDNNYTFRVLLDEMGPEGKQNKVFKQFGITHIPAKFVIDKEGIIRSVDIGYHPDQSDAAYAKALFKEIESARSREIGSARSKTR
jgi:peroxiredoxin